MLYELIAECEVDECEDCPHCAAVACACIVERNDGALCCGVTFGVILPPEYEHDGPVPDPDVPF